MDRKKDIYPTSNQYSVTPHFKLEREGFWKTLEPHKTGTDRDGMPIQGRTWVTKTLYWEESTLDTINTKRTSTDEDKISSYQTSGSVYIMISASDKENIYKVGKTTRDPIKRASEISSGTGVPTKYLVVKKWLVADCHIAEKIIHEHLKEYRINDNREFFKIEYDILSEIVDNVVKDINTSVLNTDTQ